MEPGHQKGPLRRFRGRDPRSGKGRPGRKQWRAGCQAAGGMDAGGVGGEGSRGGELLPSHLAKRCHFLKRQQASAAGLTVRPERRERAQRASRSGRLSLVKVTGTEYFF